MEAKKILVVDDTEFMMRLISSVLKSANYEVITASNGEDALKILKKERPDLILLDVVMTGISGYDVCEKLRSDFKFNLTPIIMLTGQSDEEDKLKGLELGADDYIVKPFSHRELLARVRNTLVRLERNRHANPLTGLRGNADIEVQLKKLFESDNEYSVLYLDLNNFKPYNDIYGFANGDLALKMTADIIVESVSESGNEDDFIGHIGGDDFVVISSHDKAVPIAEKVIEMFDTERLQLYNEQDRALGSITAKDRNGVMTQFPLIGISVAIVFSDKTKIEDTLHLATIAAELKKKAKSANKSSYAY